MREWERLEPSSDALRGATLDGDPARRLADALARNGRLVIRELRDGLQIETRQWVGRVRVGSLTVTVQPKVAPDLLLRLFRYAFGLRSIDRGAGVVLPEGTALQDLLVMQLAEELDALIRHGLARRYRPRHETLTSPRGRVDFARLSREPMTSGALPCLHHERDVDCEVNRALLAGALMAAGMTHDPVVRARLRGAAKRMSTTVSRVRLHDRWLGRVRRGLDRLLRDYEPALVLIHMLFRGQGIQLGDTDDAQLVIPGFLFDMNLFFESLLGRFLTDHLSGHEVRTQEHMRELYRYVPGENPRNRRRPDPRPDFLVVRDKRYIAVLDSKYRDLWNRQLPREMLYQLSLYALALPGCGSAVILYPATDAPARDAVLELRTAAGDRARVIVRPVRLDALDHVISGREETARRALAAGLIASASSSSPPTHAQPA